MTFTDHVIYVLEEGVDLAIRFGVIVDSAELIARNLTSHRWVICATPDYLKTHCIPDTLADIP